MVDYKPEDENVRTLVLLSIALATLALLAISALVAMGSDACKTYEQARAQWPRDHLYWHGSEHCWDNHRKHSPAPDRLKRVYAQAGKPQLAKDDFEHTYNEIDAIADRDPFFNARPIPYWQIERVYFPRFIPWEQRIQK